MTRSRSHSRARTITQGFCPLGQSSAHHTLLCSGSRSQSTETYQGCWKQVKPSKCLLPGTCGLLPGGQLPRPCCFSFLGVCQGSEAWEPPRKPALGKVKEASLKKAPSKTWSDQVLGSQCDHGGLSELSWHSCLLPSTRELSRSHGWFSCQLLGAFKRMIAVHWLSQAPPTSLPEQVRAVRLEAGQGLR